MYTAKRLVLFVFSVIIIFTLLTLFSEDATVPFGVYYNVTKTSKDGNNVLFDSCKLPKLDPWDPSVVKFLKPDTKYQCKPSFTRLTKLKNGQLTTTFHQNFTMCMYRCLYPVDDRSLVNGVWENITDKAYPTCDIIETKCFKDNASRPFYEFLHAQIFRNDTKETKKQPELPDVHIVLFDSVSHSAFVRALPRTYHELMANYEAIPFPHLNKLGLNSRPNALALLFALSVGYHSDFHNNEDCNKPLDDDQFIEKFFKAANYKTMICEDWAQGALTFPNCKGLVRNAADHMMKPFQLKADRPHQSASNFYANVYKKVCRETFEALLAYLNNFLVAYPDKPKFSITWITDLSHDDNNVLYHGDDKVYRFFKDNEAKFNDSFLFVMGDHGMRFGEIRNTDVGEAEDNNPFLLLSLPSSLRENNKVTTTVRHNAHELITHYDIYATLVDIVQPKNKSLVIHGSSLLRPLPQPRTCDRLRVPFEYCSCVRQKTKLPDNSTTGNAAALKMVEHMNEAIQTDSRSKYICAPLFLDQNASVTVEQLESEGKLNIYEITFNVIPGNGKFKGYIGHEGNISDIKILSARFARLNSYGKTAFCAKRSTYAAYCYCLSLLKRS